MKNNKKEKLNLIWKIVLIIVVMVAGISIASSSVELTYKNGESVSVYTQDKGASEAIRISGDCTMRQYFISDVDMVHGVRLYFSCNENVAGGKVRISLYNESEYGLIDDKEYRAEDLMNGEVTYVGFGGVEKDCKGMKMSLLLEFSGIPEDKQLYIHTRSVNDENAFLQYNEQGVENVISLELISSGKSNILTVQKVSFVAILIALLLVAYFTIFDKIDLKHYHVVYFVVAAGVGIAYLLTSLTMRAPDEPIHLCKAYSVSNHMMGIKDNENGTIKMRADDAAWQYRVADIEKSYYNEYYDDFFAKAENKELIDTDTVPAECPKYLYIFSAMGLTLGRLLGLGTVLTFLLGRLFNMLAFLLCCAYAIKKMPFAKSTIVVWSMIPLMMQQLCSYSYDCMINAMCILIVAITLDFMYGEGKKKYLSFEFVLLIMCCLLLIPCKGHALAPIAFMPLMLLVKKIKENKEAIKTKFRQLDKKLKIGGIVAVAIFVLVVLAFFIRTILILKSNSEPSTVSWCGEDGYSVGYILNNPDEFFDILKNNFLCIKNYVMELFGGCLGWLEVELYPLFVIPFMFLIVFAAMRKEGEPQPITIGNKVWILFLASLVIGFTTMGMLISWTPLSSSVIEGIQGRYFLPVLVMSIVCIRTKKACLGKKADKYIMLASTFMQLFVITNYYLCVG